MTQKKESPAGAGQDGMTGSFNSSKVTENQRNMQGITNVFAANNPADLDRSFASQQVSQPKAVATSDRILATEAIGSKNEDRDCITGSSQEFLNKRFSPHQEKKENTTSYGDTLGEFPVWHMPTDLQRVVDVVSKAYNADPIAAWVSALAVAMASLGKSCKGHFANGKYDNWPTGWFVLVGSPATCKSPIINWFARYLRQEEREAYRRYQAEEAKWKSTPKKERGEEPRHKSLLAENITDERLFQKCSENNGRLFWLGDEFDGLIGGLGMYSKNPSKAIANLKKMHSQDDVSDDTICRGFSLIENPAVTILAATHPGMVVDLMRKFVSRGDGFFERFLFVEISEQVPKLEEPDITPDVVSIWYTYVEMMLHNQLANIYADKAAEVLRNVVNKKWEKQCFDISLLAKESGDWLTARQAPIYKKAHYVLCRLAIVVARLRGEDTITEDTMRFCVDVANFFAKQQLAILSKFGERKADTLTKRDVAQWLVKNPQGHSKADIARFLYPDSDKPRQALNYLINS